MIVEVVTNGRLSDSLFCLTCIAAVLLSGAILRARAVEYAEGDAEVLAEATGIIKAFVVYVGGLFVLLAIGAASGLTGRVLALEPRPLTTFDVMYLILNVGVLVWATSWVYFQGGADLLAAHRQMFKYTPSNRVGVMLLWGFMMCLLGFAIVGVATGTGYGR